MSTDEPLNTDHSTGENLDAEDAFLDLIVDYLTGELDGAQERAVERRLVEDTEFSEYVAPIIAAWECG